MPDNDHNHWETSELKSKTTNEVSIKKKSDRGLTIKAINRNQDDGIADSDLSLENQECDIRDGQSKEGGVSEVRP